MFVSIKNTKIPSDLIFEIFFEVLGMKTAHTTGTHNTICLRLKEKNSKWCFSLQNSPGTALQFHCIDAQDWGRVLPKLLPDFSP